jgi:hypothetical protein
MATTPEGKVKDQIKKLLKKYGAYYTMPVMTGMATNGTPDFAVCHQGLYLAIEAKADSTGAPTELQWVRLREVERAGGDTMVIHAGNLEVLEKYLQAPAFGCVAVREYDSRRVLGHADNGEMQ